MDDKLYLCVDPDGTEKATNFVPRRLYSSMVSNAKKDYVDSHPVENYGEDCWIDCISDTDYGYYGFDYSFDGITLPTGTIEKMIGRKMTWDDEPAEYVVMSEKETMESELDKNICFDSLEEKCRHYQKLSDITLLSDRCIMIHLDGRSFSKSIKNRFKKPFDDDFVAMMNETAKYVVQNVPCAKIAYVQSDEISIVVNGVSEDGVVSEPFFGGRICKIDSIVSSLATSKFNRLMGIYSLENGEKKDCIDVLDGCPLYQFDCKCWNVKNLNDAYAWLLFRQNDCIRNSKQQAAQVYFSHKELEGKTCDEQVDMMMENGVNWENYPDGVRIGRVVIRKEVKMSRVNEDGTTNDFIRYKWDITDAFDFKTEENKTKIIDLIRK